MLSACAVLCLAGHHFAGVQTRAQVGSALSRWRSREYAGVRYVGDRACASCHTVEAAKQFDTPMAHALKTAAGCDVLISHTSLEFREGPFTYRIIRRGDQSIYTVTDGAVTISEPVAYCFGQGEVGQTYLVQHGGKFYESRVSFFRNLQGLDITVGQTRTTPASVADALGRPVGNEEALSCFGCHAPEAVAGSRLQLDSPPHGVSCEACHGPGERHVAAARSKNLKDPRIFNPGDLEGPELSQEFCGTCHLSFEQAMLLPEQGGINNLRFQAYRIFNSPGHRGGDRRISCVACHDPHDKLERAPAFYDSKCLACHLSDSKQAKTVERAAPACPVSRQQCVTCHMPKIELPGMHSKFTDHWIRVVKPDEPVPH